MGSEKVWNVIEEINRSKIDFFNHSDFVKYEEFTFNYENNTVTFKNNTGKKLVPCGELISVEVKPAKSFKFTDLYNISSIKIHYEDCSSTEVKLKLKEEQAIDMDKYSELLDYVNANRPNPLGNIKQPQVAFIPAIAGNKPIFDGQVL